MNKILLALLASVTLSQADMIGYENHTHKKMKTIDENRVETKVLNLLDFIATNGRAMPNYL